MGSFCLKSRAGKDKAQTVSSSCYPALTPESHLINWLWANGLWEICSTTDPQAEGDASLPSRMSLAKDAPSELHQVNPQSACTECSLQALLGTAWVPVTNGKDEQMITDQ